MEMQTHTLHTLFHIHFPCRCKLFAQNAQESFHQSIKAIRKRNPDN